jgi:tetrahydromethanopterin S-methyltransferase subunit G
MINDNENISLKEHFEILLRVHDEKNTLQFNAMQTAVSKAEVATEKRFEGVNEFRGQLSDQSRTLMPRAETEVKFNSINARLDEIAKQQEKLANIKQGAGNMYILIVGVLGILMGIASFILNIMGN